MTEADGRHRPGAKAGLAVLAWAVAGVSGAGFAGAWVLAVRNRDVPNIGADWGPDRFLVAYAVTGAVVASRRPANPVGWLLLGIGLVTACRGLAGEYALYALAGPARPASGVWAAWFVRWSLSLLFPGGLLTFLLLLFPDGHALTPRWRAVGLLGAGVSVVIRYRRSAGEERLQLKWFAYAAGLSLVLMLALLPVAVTSAGQVTYDLAIVAGIGLALPVAIGVAVLKYRLYAIHRIISRSVSYAVVTGLVVGVYLGCVALLTDVLPFRGTVGVAIAVLVAAAAFNPLRRRVQALVDRRFDRARYDAERVVAQFAVQLREQVDLDVLGAGLLGVVNHVLAPEHVALWLQDTGLAPGAEVGDGVLDGQRGRE